MSSFATLALDADSRGLEQGVKALDKVVDRGGAAADAADRVAGGVKDAGNESTKAAGPVQRLTDRLRGASQHGGRLTDALQGVRRGLGYIAGAATAAGAVITVAVRGQLNAIDALAKQSERIGIPIEHLSQLEHAANLSGVSMQTMEGAMRQLSRSMVDTPDKFKDLGINVRNADGELRATADVMEDVADVLAAMPEGAERTALTFDLMSRYGTQMLPMLNQGGDAIRAMRDEADRLGLTLTQETADAVQAFNDNLARITGQGRGFWRMITAELAPTLERLSDVLVNAAQRFGDLSPEMRRMIAMGAGLLAALVPVAAIVGTLALALAGLSLPVLIVIGAFATLAALTATYWDEISGAVDRGVHLINERHREIDVTPAELTLGQFLDNIKTTWDSIPSLFATLTTQLIGSDEEFTQASNTLTTNVARLVERSGERWEVFKDQIRDSLSDADGQLGVFGASLEQFASGIGTVLDTSADLGSAFVNAITGRFDEATDAISRIPGRWGGYLQDTAERWDFLGEAVSDALTSATQAIETWASNTAQSIDGVIEDAGRMAREWAAKIGEMYEAVRGLGASIVSALRDSASDVLAAARNLGENIADGVRDGINRARSRASAAINRLTGGLIGQAESDLDIQSPSKVFAQIGSDIVEGLGVGIMDNENYALGAMRGVTDTMKYEVQNAAGAISGAFQSAFEGILNGTTSLRGALRSLANDLRSSLASSISSSIFGGQGAGGAQGGGMLGGLIPAAGQGTGFMGGLGNAMGGSPFSIGANAAAAGGGIMATMGAALPVVGAVIGGLFTFARARAERWQSRMSDRLERVQQQAAERDAALETRLQSNAQAVDSLVASLQTLENMEREREQAARAVLQERSNLEVEMLRLQNDVAALREREIQALEPVNRQLGRFVNALRNVSDAVVEQERALESLASAGRGIMDFVFGASGGEQRQFQRDLELARGGDLVASQRLPRSAGAAQGSFEQTATSAVDLARFTGRMLSDMAETPAAMAFESQQIDLLEQIRDGVTQLSEIEANVQGSLREAIATGFFKLDENLDGKLTFDELRRGLRSVASERQLRDLLDSTDQNGSGTISRLEALGGSNSNIDENTLENYFATIDQLSELKVIAGETMNNTERVAALTASIDRLVLSQRTEAGATLSSLQQQRSSALSALQSAQNRLSNTDEEIRGPRRYGLFGPRSRSPNPAYVALEADIRRFQQEIDALDAQLANVPAFASGGVHMGGVRLVGERGPELEVTGPSRIYSSAETRQMLRDDGSRDEIAAMRAELRGYMRELVRDTHQQARTLRRWEIEGLPAEAPS